MVMRRGVEQPKGDAGTVRAVTYSVGHGLQILR